MALRTDLVPNDRLPATQWNESAGKLNTVAENATSNSPDATLKNRANHTGTQASSTISDFAPAVNSIASNYIAIATIAASPATVPANTNAVYVPDTLNVPYPNFAGLTPTKPLSKFIFNGTAWVLIEWDIDLTGYVQNADFDPLKDDVEDYKENIIIDQTGNVLFVDADGNVALKIDKTGTVHLYKLLLNFIKIGDTQLSEDNRYAYSIQDANGNVAYALTKLGKVLASIIEFKNYRLYPIEKHPFELQDVNGNYLAFIDKSSNLHVGKVTTKSIETSSLKIAGQSLIPRLQLVYGNPTDWLLIISYGQSNSQVSGNSTQVLTPIQRYDSLMSIGGNNIYSGFNSFDTAPYIEGTGNGETLLGGSLEKFNELVINENFTPYQNKGFQLFGLLTGMGGKSIAALSKGGSDNLYSNMVSKVLQVVALAKAKGKNISVPFLYWTQGEDDNGTGKTYEYYIGYLNQLVTDLNNDVKAITGQRNNFPLIGYQLNHQDTVNQDLNRISKAHLMAGLTNPLFICATPTYQLQVDSTDTVHFTPKSKRILGAYYAIAAKRTIVDGKKFRPCYPVQVWAVGNTVFATYHVPQPPLVFDTTLIPAGTNKGFRVLNSSGTDLTLTNIKLVSENTVSMDCSASPAGGTYIYARTTDNKINNGDGTMWMIGRGNLRDSQGDYLQCVIDAAGDLNAVNNNYPLHNWAVVSYLPIT